MACSHSVGVIAAKASFLLILLGLLALIHVHPAVGTIECEDLPVGDCAFAVASSGARCVLEKVVKNNADPQYKCQTSIIMAERPLEWIESDDCIKTCGLQRLSVGLSTDALLERDFTKRLCFSECRSKCPNINDLYTKLAAEEGIYLPSLCDSLKPSWARRLGAEERQDQSESQLYDSVPITAAVKKTEVHILGQKNGQSLQLAEAARSAISPAPMTTGWWPVTMSPKYHPVVEGPYPAQSPKYHYPVVEEPYPAQTPGAIEPPEAEPPYVYGGEFPYWPSPTPAPGSGHGGAGPAPYLYNPGYEPSPSPSSLPFSPAFYPPVAAPYY